MVYATLCNSERIGEKKTNNEVCLGRVIDTENWICYNRSKGYYKYDLDTGFSELSDEEILFSQKTDKTHNTRMAKEDKLMQKDEPLIINFGHSFIINEFIKQNNLLQLFPFMSQRAKDSLLSLINFKIIENNDYYYAEDWWEGDYASYLYPYANLKPKKINELLCSIGSKAFFRDFFENYISYLKSKSEINGMIIDRNDLPNDMKDSVLPDDDHDDVLFPKEFRLIRVVDRITGIPLFYRYISDMTIDVKTLNSPISDINYLEINIDSLNLSTRYYSRENISELINLEIPFMVQLPQREEYFSLLLKKYSKKLHEFSNIVSYEKGCYFVNKVEFPYLDCNSNLFAYICYDLQKYRSDLSNYMEKTDIKKLANEQFHDANQAFGVFILLSSLDLPKEELVTCYLSKPSIDQFLDSVQKNIDILSLRRYSENAFNGHLILSFISTTIAFLIDKQLKENKLSFTSGMQYLKRLHADVYKSKIMPKKTTKNINNILKALKIKLPSVIDKNIL